MIADPEACVTRPFGARRPCKPAPVRRDAHKQCIQKRGMTCNRSRTIKRVVEIASNLRDLHLLKESAIHSKDQDSDALLAR